MSLAGHGEGALGRPRLVGGVLLHEHCRARDARDGALDLATGLRLRNGQNGRCRQHCQRRRQHDQLLHNGLLRESQQNIAKSSHRISGCASSESMSLGARKDDPGPGPDEVVEPPVSVAGRSLTGNMFPVRAQLEQSGPNEVFAPDGTPRELYRPVLDELERMGVEEWERRTGRARERYLAEQHGFGILEGDKRHPTDWFPRLLSATDWEERRRGNQSVGCL